MDNTLIDLLDRLDARHDAGAQDGAAYTITNAFFTDLGFRYVNIGVASKTDNASIGMFSNMSDDWLSHYVASGYHTCDVMFDYAIANASTRMCAPETNRHLPSKDKARSDQMLREVQAEGLVSSLIVPRHSAVSDHMIGYNLCTDLNSDKATRLFGARDTVIAIGAALTQTAIIEDIEGDSYGVFWLPFREDTLRLSPREAEVLKWLSEGYRNDRIADHLRISSATVNFHVTSAKKKLGAKTREQAVAISLRQGLI